MSARMKISLVLWIVSIETDLRVTEAYRLEPFPGASSGAGFMKPQDKGPVIFNDFLEILPTLKKTQVSQNLIP